jgi:hypothetical protein
MSQQNQELKNIITKFADSGWDLIEDPAKAWLSALADLREPEEETPELVIALKQADEECGSCGCEYDALYKRAIALLTA